MNASLLIFWGCFFSILYVTVGYYLCLKVLNFFSGKYPVLADDSYIPHISIIMLAYNEEKIIDQWFERIAKINYPQDRLELIVVSDGSTDRTAEIMRRRAMGNDNIKVLDFEKNRGRALCHNDAVAAASNEMIISTDAETEFEPETVQRLARHMKDERIGGVLGRLRYRRKHDTTSRFEKDYLSFELALKMEESRLGILSVGMGCCFCIRKSLYVNLAPRQDIDNVYPLFAVKRGYRLLLEPEAVVYDSSPSSTTSEFKARIRITSRSLKDNLASWSLRDCLKFPAITWGIVSHRIMRWMLPFFLASLYVSNIALLGKSGFYVFFFVGHSALYLSALIGLAGERLRFTIPFFSRVYIFMVAMIGIGIGVIKAIFGEPPARYLPAK